MNNITITQEWTTQLVKVRVMKRVKIKVYEEINNLLAQHIEFCDECDNAEIEWVDNNGTNTPYKVSYV